MYEKASLVFRKRIQMWRHKQAEICDAAAAAAIVMSPVNNQNVDALDRMITEHLYKLSASYVLSLS